MNKYSKFFRLSYTFFIVSLLLFFVSLISLTSCVEAQSSCDTTSYKWKASPHDSMYINSVAISGDGGKVVGGTFFHSYSATRRDEKKEVPDFVNTQTATFGTYCYDSTGTVLWKDEFYGWEGVYWVDISEDGNYAASGGWYSNNPYTGFVFAYDANNGNKILDFKTSARVNEVSLSSDGTYLISASGNVNLFQLINGKYQVADTFKFSSKTDAAVSAAISANGETIVFSDYDGFIYVCKNESGKFSLLKKWALPNTGFCRCVRVTPDGKSFAAGGTPGYFYLFDLESLLKSGEPAATFSTGESGMIYGVAITDDGSGVIGITNYKPYSSEGGYVYYFSKSDTLKWKFYTNRNPNSASINSAKGIVAVADGHPDGSPGDYYLIDINTGKCKWSYQTNNMSWPIQISQNGNAIAAGSDDSNIYYFVP